MKFMITIIEFEQLNFSPCVFAIVKDIIYKGEDRKSVDSL